MSILEILKSQHSHAQKVKLLKSFIQQEDSLSFDLANAGDQTLAFAQALENNTNLKKLHLNLAPANSIILLASFLRDNQSLTDLELKRIGAPDNNELEILRRALSQNSTLKKLSLKSCVRKKELNSLALLLKEHPELEKINIKFHTDATDTDIAPVMSTLKRHPNLKSVKLNNIGDLSAQALAAVFNKDSKLRTLSLKDKGISDIGIQALASSLEKTRDFLQFRLKLNNALSSQGSEALAKMLKTNSTLKHLDLQFSKIQPEALPALCDAIEKNTSLQTLKLPGVLYQRQSDAKIREYLHTLAESLAKNQYLTKIDLVYNSIDNAGIKAISNIIERNKNLKDLTFQGDITDGVAENFKLALEQNQSLTRLKLRAGTCSQNAINQIGLAIKSKIPLQTLQLELKPNLIPRPGHFDTRVYVDSIITTLEAPYSSLTTLEISGSGIKNIQCLAKVLRHNKTLTHLKLNCRLTAEQAESIAQALSHNNTLTHLDLSSNQFGPQGVKPFAELLKTNQTLKHLDISDNQISNENLEAFASSLNHNKTLTHLVLNLELSTPQVFRKLVDSLKNNLSILSLKVFNNALRLDVTAEFFREEEERLNLFLARNNAHKRKQDRVVAEAVQLPAPLINIINEYLDPSQNTTLKYNQQTNTLLDKISRFWVAFTEFWHKAYLKVKAFIGRLFTKKPSIPVSTQTQHTPLSLPSARSATSQTINPTTTQSSPSPSLSSNPTQNSVAKPKRQN